jgi:anti-sigma factor RsiW
MNPKSCAAIQESFSAYLDGAISGHEMQEISRHIEGSEDAVGCTKCANELEAWKATQNTICAVRPAKAPEDLALRLRIAISREQARRESHWRDRLSLAWDNAVRPLLVQVSAGVAGTVVLVGSIVMLLGVVAAPQEVLANDEPLGAVTAPHYLYSMVSPGAIVTPHEAAIVVEASVNSAGRVYDFTIVSGPQDQGVWTQVANQLMGSVFEPASAFGVPIRGRVIVTFSGISVRG